MKRQFRAVCKECGKQYDWRDSFERAESDHDEHLEMCWTVTAARRPNAADVPTVGYESRGGGE